MRGELASAVLVPGWSMVGRGRRAGFLLLALGVVAPVALVVRTSLSGRNWVALTLDTGYLALLVAVGGVALTVRFVALVESWVAAGRPRLAPADTAVAGIALVALVGGGFLVVDVARARAAIAPAFTTTSRAPLFDATAVVDPAPYEPPMTTTTTSSTTTTSTVPTLGVERAPTIEVTTTSTTSTTTTTLPPRPVRPRSGVEPEWLVDVSTVLLIGGDAGPGRSGLRTDTMMLFSIHRPTGRAALVSVPRNLERLLFPPGSALESGHPFGYPGLANAVYPDVMSHGRLRDAYDADGIRPGIAALAEGIGYSLDVTIDDYVLVDMQGFLDLIDALDGVTVDVPEAVPMPGNVPGARSQYPPTIGPGLVWMDGSTALGYVRSRKADNDYRRTRRQRELLAALATQLSWRDVAASFGDVAGAIGGTLRTSLTPDELAETLNVIGGDTAIVESVGLVPPLVNVRRPDLDAMAKVVGAVQLALVTGDPSGY